MDISKSVTIHAPATAVWDLLTDPEKVKIWNTSFVGSEPVSEGEIRAGFRSKTTLQEGGKEVVFDEEIQQFDPPETLRLSIGGGNLGAHPMNVAFHLQQQGSETVVTSQCSWAPSGIFLRLIAPLITRMARKTLDDQLTRLKALAEGT